MDIRNTPRVVLRDASSAEWLHFENPRQVIVSSHLHEVVPALNEIEALVNRNGWYAAGFISYEAAPAFDSAFTTHPSAGFPLLWFGLYPRPRKTTALPPEADVFQQKDSDEQLGTWLPSVTDKAYDAAITRIKQHIADGETYQVNFTFRLRSKFSGSPWPFFVEMLDAQAVGYPAFIDTGRHVICCTSPELFFRLEGDQVTCRPMKGTARRGRTLAEDEAQAEWLSGSEKNRAENVMIVDMLRNDLGRVAEIGSVRVPQLFSVERYRTLWQMTSTVSAEVKAPFADILAALFPSASITGAPKVSTMKIISALEAVPRRIYTGSIGYLAPGRQAQFNVAIRTVMIDRETGEADYGVGGGVVWDSTAQDEYAEALLKGRILTERQPEFSLLETLRWTPEQGYFLLERHLKRLRDSATYFGLPLDAAQLEAHLAGATRKLPASPHRVRLLLASNGKLTHQVFPMPLEDPKPLRVRLAAQPVDSENIFLFHKTTRREVYEQARAGQPDCDDVLLYNQRGELTESTIANLVVELDDDPSLLPPVAGHRLVTPPVACGLLAGTFRAALLEQGMIEERIVRREDLARCTKLFLVNSVREWQPVEML